ncbi:odorant receptor 2a-like isoform X4 [Periplaneta americana]|uniref:odorant receptor 2a-like isoform X4 n=1 Tax=Periplaneta americana TaxID=6978 RepID=UPI0037E86310
MLRMRVLSLETANAAYGCNWFDGSSQLKHELMFIIARTLNPVKLTCGKMYQLSLENLTEVPPSESYHPRSGRVFINEESGFILQK